MTFQTYSGIEQLVLEVLAIAAPLMSHGHNLAIWQLAHNSDSHPVVM